MYVPSQIMVPGNAAAVGETPIILWLLIKGVKNNLPAIDKK
jgi:hypothetical protein